MKTKLLTLLVLIWFVLQTNAQCSGDVNIPDQNFKDALLADITINTDENDQISCTEASSYTGTINVNRKSITDLTGIEAFTNITELTCNSNNDLMSLNIANNTALTFLSCNSTNIINLDISNNTALTRLDCVSTGIANLDVSNNPALTMLSCSNNSINSLNLSNNPALTRLDCSSTNITHLDVTNNTALINLSFNNIAITSINLSNNIALTNLSFFGSSIANIDLSNNTALTNLTCNSSAITEIDLSNNIALTDLRIDGNNLSNLDVSNNPLLTSLNCINTGISNLELSNNPALTILFTSDNTELSALDLSANTLLERLSCANTGIISFNLSNNAALTNVDVANNPNLIRLIISNHPQLTSLQCSNSSLTNIDVSNSNVLTRLFCQNNKLTSLNIANGNNFNMSVNAIDFSGNPTLGCIEVDDEMFANDTWTDVKDPTASYSINCSFFVKIPDENFKNSLLTEHDIDENNDNQISFEEAINFTEVINVSGKSIADLTGIEAFTNITRLNCSANLLTSLDVSTNTSLVSLICANNNLSTLNLANGNNVNFTSEINELNITNNTNLTCIQVDDVVYANNNWSALKDNIATYNINCNVVIPDSNFKNALLHQHEIDTNNDNEISFTEAEAYEGVINVRSLFIADLTGLEAFVNITEFYCVNNSITTIDVSANTNLTQLEIINNSLLTSLDVTNNTALTNLVVSNSFLITSLDVSNNSALTHLSCHNNRIENLDVSSNINLVALLCYNNALESLDVSNNNNLVSLHCHSNKLTELNIKNGNNTNMIFGEDSRVSHFTNNLNLFCIQVDDVTYANENWTDPFIKDEATIYSQGNCKQTLTLTATGGELTTDIVANDGVYDFGRMVEITATPQEGYMFNGWGGDASGMGNPLSVVMDVDKNITALFVLIQRTLTVTTENGTVVSDIAPINGTYDIGTVIELTAMPDTGYEFTDWDGDATGTNNPLRITIIEDTEITANFALLQFTLDTNAVNGTIATNIAPTNGTYDFGTTVELIATPEEGYVFNGWDGDASGMDNPLSIVIDADKNITALFIEDPTANVEDVLTKTVKIYPNPTANNITISLLDPLKSIEIFDFSGKKILTTISTNINLTDLSSGVYLIKITTKNFKTAVKKVVKQ